MTSLLKTPNIGTGVLEDRDRIDFAGLRASRRERVFDEMARRGVDACVFGREGNVRYVSGARRLWTAGTRPFAPGCLVVGATGRIDLLSFSASYEGIPAELGPEDMYPLSWNPQTVIQRFRAAVERAGIRTLGVDGMTPLFEGLLPQAFPDATIVPFEASMRNLRRTKLPSEMACIRTAVAIAESALYSAARRVAPAVTERTLQGVFLRRMCELGTSQFAQQGAFTAIGADGHCRRVTGDGALDDGRPVALSGGVLWAGYEASLARTWWCGRQVQPTAADRAPAGRWRVLFDEILGHLVPGGTGAQLGGLLESVGGDAEVAVYSLGLGHEGSIYAPGLPPAVLERQRLDAGMVVGIRIYVPGAQGGYLAEEMVHIGDAGPEILTTLGHGTLAADPEGKTQDA